MNRYLRSLVLGLAAFAALVLAGPASAAQTELNFGIINTESSQNLRHIWDPFLADMAKDTGFKINAFFASDYAGVIAAMQYDKIQLAWYGGKSAMEAVDRANGEVFMQTVAANGTDGYYAHLIVHASSPLTSEKDVLDQAANLTFGNGDPNSTSGFLVPGYYVFGMNGVDPKTIFKRVLNAGHETNGLSVANRQVDVATFNSEAMERLQITQPEKAAQLKIIWTSPLIPSDPLVWRTDLSPEIKAKLVSFFTTYGQPGRPEAAREKEVMAALQWSGFRPSTNDQLIPIRQLELFKEKTTVENNPNIPEADKKARIAEIDAQLATVNARAAELARAGK